MLVSFTTNAQFKKAEKFVEGTVSYSKTSGTDAQYTLNPTVGYFLTDRFAVGVSGKFGKDATQTNTFYVKVESVDLKGNNYSTDIVSIKLK